VKKPNVTFKGMILVCLPFAALLFNIPLAKRQLFESLVLHGVSKGVKRNLDVPPRAHYKRLRK
jgi:hypothetical protein